MIGLVNWFEEGVVDYRRAIERMNAYALEVAHNKREPFVWILRHPGVYTYGASFVDQERIDHLNAPVVKAFRGGQLTYHGPGQLVVYPILPLMWFNNDLHKYVSFLESWVVRVCALLGVCAFTIAGSRGVFTQKGKIGFVGVSSRKYITMHGFSLNVSKEDEAFFNMISPCGLDVCVTSLENEIQVPPLQDIIARIREEFCIHL